MNLELPGFKVYVATETFDGFDGNEKQSYLSSIKASQFTELKECAILRLYSQALEDGRLNDGDLAMCHFVTTSGHNLPITSEQQAPLYAFFNMVKEKHGEQYYPVGLNQHMSEVGKVLIAKRPVKEMLAELFDQEFSDAMDRNKWLKMCQIACQPGTITMAPFNANVYVDEKRESEDGVIFVSPKFWAEVIRPSYAHLLAKPEALEFIDLIKVNSANADLVVKGVMQRSHPEGWEFLCHRMGIVDEPDSVDIVLCGNAIKYNRAFEIGKIYSMTQDRFAYHSDSSIARGMYVNVSKQVITRSGMDAQYFIDQTIGPVVDRIQGLMQFDEEHVLRAIGMLSKDGEPVTLDRAAAIQTRIVDHCLPANHPANAAQIWDLGMTFIRDRANRISVEGFHGMGGISSLDVPGYVQISRGIHERWMRRHGTNEAYCFRMPYLGAYCGKWVKLLPADTDSILLHWEDALQMEGDFDGDQYYLIPAKYFRAVDSGVKPERPHKEEKAAIPLNDTSLVNAIMELTDAKVGIGQRDYMLCLAYDYWMQSRASGDFISTAEWEEKVKILQIWVQQAVEGIKHSTEGMLSIEEARKLLPSLQAHPYTKLFTNSVFRQTKLYSTRNHKGYIDMVKEAVSDEHSWHPLHNIFLRLSKLEFGKPSEGWEYWEAVKKPEPTTIDRPTFLVWVSRCRVLHREYTQGVRKWAGGANRNLVFARDVLGPIRTKWNAAIEAYKDKPGWVLDLHLAMAHVAYEPKPNYELQTQVKSMATSRYTLSDDIDSISSIEPYDHRGILEGRATYVSPASSISVHKFLPASGSLLHHLGDPAVIRYIFKDVDNTLQEGQFEEILLEGLQELAEEL